VRLEPERDALPRMLAFVYAPLAVAIWWAARLAMQKSAGRGVCMLLESTGVACPTCGGTRAVLALGRGDPVRAAVENPLVAAGALLLGLWFFYAVAATAVPRLRVTPHLAPSEARTLRIAAASAIALTWIYEIIRHS
jgi:hypothetical protein